MQNISSLLCCIIYFISTHIVNNYEISEWEYKYLCIWSECNEYPYITPAKLCACLDVNEIDIIRFYFDIYGILFIL